MPEQSPTRFTMVPARRSNEPTARRRARRILNALFLAAALSVVAVFVALSKGQAEADLSTVDPKGRALAYTAAVNQLMGVQQNVPHATTFDPEDAAGAATNLSAGRPSAPLPYQSLSWAGFTPQHFGSQKAGYTDFEVHHFLVVLGTPAGSPGASAAAGKAKATPTVPATSPTASAPATSPTNSTVPSAAGSPSPAATPTEDTGTNGTAAPASNVLQLDVTVLLTSQGPRLAAVPAFSVWRGGLGAAAGKGDYTNYSDLTRDVSEAVKSQVARWAQAYVNGDSAGLLAITGDQNSDHRYLGLSGFTLPNSNQGVQILSAITVARGQLIIRVRVLLARAVPGGTVSGGKGTDQQFTTYADFDLLVGAPTGAQPQIVAWGPAGSAAELEPYSNAQAS
jgi:hypothetical protein